MFATWRTVWVKRLVIQLFEVMTTALENINQNSLLQYFMMHDVFDALIHVRSCLGKCG